MGQRLRIVIAVIGVMALFAGSAQAQTAQRPAATTETRGQLGASINNAGLQQSFDWAWQRPLSASKGLLLSEAHVALGGTAALTPAALRGGAWVEIAPVSFFVVRAGVDPSQYFGTFDALTSFESRTDAFDSDARKARATAKAGRATKFYVEPTLQIRVGHVAGKSTLGVERWSASVAGPLFYEPTRDALMAVSGDRLTTWSTVVLYEHRQKGGGTLSVGPMHSLTRVHGNTLNQIQRVGAVLVEQTTGRHFGLRAPRATILVAHYLDDASKRGEWSAAVAVGFALRHR